MKTCSIEGCAGVRKTRGWCQRHYKAWQRHGDPLHRERAPAGSGTIVRGYRVLAHVKEHVAIAEKAFGRPLPPGAVVHHADCDRSNNDNSNLVICPSHAYHNLLHQRIKAMNGCGNPDFRKCVFCKQWDSTINLHRYNNQRAAYHHRSCHQAYNSTRTALRRAMREEARS